MPRVVGYSIPAAPHHAVALDAAGMVWHVASAAWELYSAPRAAGYRIPAAETLPGVYGADVPPATRAWALRDAAADVVWAGEVAGSAPARRDVRLGVDTGGNGPGTLVVPVPADVRLGVSFDAEPTLTGTYDGVGPQPGRLVRLALVLRTGAAAPAGKEIWLRLIGDAGVLEPIEEDELRLVANSAGEVATDLVRRGGMYDVLEHVVSGGVVRESYVASFVVPESGVFARTLEVQA